MGATQSQIAMLTQQISQAHEHVSIAFVGAGADSVIREIQEHFSGPLANVSLTAFASFDPHALQAQRMTQIVFVVDTLEPTYPIATCMSLTHQCPLALFTSDTADELKCRLDLEAKGFLANCVFSLGPTPGISRTFSLVAMLRVCQLRASTLRLIVASATATGLTPVQARTNAS